MPRPATTSEFLALLDRSGLVTKEQADKEIERSESEGGTCETPKQLATILLERKLITPFHAEQLLAGRHKGFLIGKYKILDLIGSGGMGRVFLAEHTLMRRQVAMKVLPKRKSGDTSALGRFLREARAVAALNHPNIIQAYDIDIFAERP